MTAMSVTSHPVAEEPLLGSSYAVYYCATSLVGGNGRKSQASSHNLPREIEKQVGDRLSSPSVSGGSQVIFPKFILVTVQASSCLHGLFGYLQGGQVTWWSSFLTVPWPAK